MIFVKSQAWVFPKLSGLPHPPSPTLRVQSNWSEITSLELYGLILYVNTEEPAVSRMPMGWGSWLWVSFSS